MTRAERRKHRLLATPGPGETPLKAWLISKGEQAGSDLRTMYSRLYDGSIPYPPVRRVNKRVIFVKTQQQTEK